MYKLKVIFHCFLLAIFFCPLGSDAQHEHHQHADVIKVLNPSEVQPFIAQVMRLEKALAMIGSPLQEGDRTALLKLKDDRPGETTVSQIQKILDPYCITQVTINPEARVSVLSGVAKPVLVQGGKNAAQRCWQMKNNNIRAEEKAEAKQAYDKAILFYDQLVNSSNPQ